MTATPQFKRSPRSLMTFSFEDEAQAKSFFNQITFFGYKGDFQYPDEAYPVCDIAVSYDAWRDFGQEATLKELAALYGGEYTGGATFFEGRDGAEHMLSWPEQWS